MEQENQNQTLPIENKPKKKINASVRAFILSIGIIFLIMVVAFILTQTISAGEFKDGVYHKIEKDFPFWKFILSPFLLFGSDNGANVAMIMAFLFVISGVMGLLDRTKVLNYALDRLVYKFGHRRYLLISLIILFFMSMGSLIGSFEEIIPFVPLLIILCSKLGFDKYVGLSISLLAVGCGFSCGILNPFTVGIAQKQAGLPAFSGAWLRIVSFVLVYILLTGFTIIRARKNAKENNFNINDIDLSEKNPDKFKAGLAFGISIFTGLILVIICMFIDSLQSISLVFLALGFLVGGILSNVFLHIPFKVGAKDFLMGIVSMLPAAAMLMLASSVNYILTESCRMPTILNFFINATQGVNRIAILLIIYAIMLIFNLFIPSGSAKAMLLIPLIAPIAKEHNLSQLMILAFAFGDGFSNLVYPTNPVFLVSLNLSETSYGKYIKNTWPFFLSLFTLSILILLFGFAVGY